MSTDIVYDLCVVGAGMFGSAAARHASANPSLKVCLIGPSEPTAEERTNRELFASHYDEGRIARILDEQTACQILSKQSINRYQELEKLSGINFHTPVGCLFMGKKNGNFMLRMSQASGPYKVSLLDLTNRDVLCRRYPYLQLRKDEYALLDVNGSGHISPRKLVSAQKKVAELQGCHIINDAVCGVKTLPNGVNEIETEANVTIRAKRLLIATGAFVNLKELEPLKSLEVKRLKETVVLLKVPRDEVERLSSLPDMIISRTNNRSSTGEIGVYILPPILYPDGQYYLKFGDLYPSEDEEVQTLEEIKNWYLSKGDEKLMDTHFPLVTDLLPGEFKIHGHQQTGIVTCSTPSGLPYIDRVSPTVTIAVAGNGKGAKFSDEVGRIAAHLCVTGQWDSDLPQEQFRAIFQ